MNHVWGTSSESAQLLNHVWGTSSESAQLLNHVSGTSCESAHFWDPKMFTTLRERGYKQGCYYYNNNYIKTYPCVLCIF